MSYDLQSLLIAVAVVALAPFVGRLCGGRLPTVALWMVGGIAAGPSGLGWIPPSPALDLFAKIGLGLIFAMIGLSIDGRTLQGTPGRLGAIGWFATLGVGVLLALLLPLGGLLRPVALVIALSSTALLLGSDDPINTALSVGLVGLVAVVLAWMPSGLRETRAWTWLGQVVDGSAATALQLLFLLVVALIALSTTLGVDILMGTVLAGLVMRRFTGDPEGSMPLKQLEASAYGLFIPLFFVVAGTRLDLASLAVHPWGPLLCLAGILVMRGLPQWLLYRPVLPDPKERLRFALLVSQSLNLPIVVGYLEVQAGLMTTQVEAALVGGSLLSVLLLPALAMALKK